MICKKCADAADQKVRQHQGCPGKGWCDCQHRKDRVR